MLRKLVSNEIGLDKGMDTKLRMETKERAEEGNRLGSAKISKLLWEFSIPAVAGFMFSSLYNVVDTVFLGHAVGKVGVAVTTLMVPVMVILIGFSMWAGQGGNALAAIQLGRGEIKKVERTLGNTTLLLVLLAAGVMGAVLLFSHPLLILIGTDPDTYEAANTFLHVICLGFVFLSLGGGLNHFLRTMGKPRLSLAVTVFGTVMCAVFNYLLVFVLKYGVFGSALATILGQLCSMVPVMYYLTKSPTAPFHLTWAGLKPDFRLMRKILGLGMASFMMQVAFTVVSIILNQLLTTYGSQHAIGAAGALAAVGVAQKLIMFGVMPLVGVMVGAQPIIGFNYGAENWSRVKECMLLGTKVCVTVATLFFVVAQVFPAQLVRLFGVESNLEDFAVLAVRVDCAVFPFVGAQVFGASYFQSSGQPLKSTILECSRQFIFLIPLYLCLPPLLFQLARVDSLLALIMAVPVSDFLAFLVTASLVAVEMRKINQRVAIEKQRLLAA